jgi:hypothetical protein
MTKNEHEYISYAPPLHIRTNYLIITLCVIVTLLPRLIILRLPLIPMAVRPSRVREGSFAVLTRHFGSSSGVQDYLASRPFL